MSSPSAVRSCEGRCRSLLCVSRAPRHFARGREGTALLAGARVRIQSKLMVQHSLDVSGRGTRVSWTFADLAVASHTPQTICGAYVGVLLTPLKPSGALT